MSDRVGTDEVFWPDADSDNGALCQSLLNAVDDGIYQLDGDSRFVAINDTLAEMTGYARDDLLGEHLSLVVAGRDRSSAIDDIFGGSTDVDGDGVPLTLVSADGDRIDSEHRLVQAGGTGDDAGGIAAVVHRVEPGSGNVDGPMAVPRERTLANALNEADGVGVFVLDADFEVAWIDDTIERYFGIPKADVIGQDKRRLVEEEIRSAMANSERFAETVLATYDQNTASEQFECHVTAGDGREERWLEHRSNPIRSGRYEGGRIELYYDITDRKRSEVSLQETEERFRTLVDAVEDYAIFRLDPDGNVISWNQGAQRIKGYDAEEILGEHFSTFYTDEDRADGIPERNLEAATESGSTEDEGWRVRKDGTYFWANVTITAITGDDGTHRGYLKVTRDMTDRYEHEQELESQLQRVFDRISDGFFALDEDFQFTHVNDRAERILAVDAEELIGSKIWSALPEIQETAFEERYREAMTSQNSLSFEEYYPPTDAWYEVHAYPSTSGLSVYFRDVTGRREREQELRRTERRFEAIFEDPNILVGLLEPDGTVLDINQTAMEYIDADLEAVTGEPFWETPWWGEGDGIRDAVKEWTEQASAGEYVDFEADLTRPTGEEYTLTGYFRPVTNDEGETVSIIVSDRDITERKQRERELEASNERLEQFAYAASHDLQEPLRMISSYLQLLEDRYADELGPDGREFIDFAVDGADRMREMIEGLLEYSRVETQGDPFQPVDLETVLADVREDLRLQIEESDAEIDAEELPFVEGDPNQLRQIFQNLLDNAIEYSGDEPPRVDVSAERNGDMWVISIADNGIGIHPENADQIFEVFDRLHSRDEHEGTGIGLALCERIVERHGGDMWVDSEPGEGATFSFTLSATERNEEPDT